MIKVDFQNPLTFCLHNYISLDVEKWGLLELSKEKEIPYKITFKELYRNFYFWKQERN